MWGIAGGCGRVFFFAQGRCVSDGVIFLGISFMHRWTGGPCCLLDFFPLLRYKIPLYVRTSNAGNSLSSPPLSGLDRVEGLTIMGAGILGDTATRSTT